MSRSRARTLGRSLGLVLGSALIGALGGGFVLASIPAPDGTINACYDQRSGELRVIDVQAGGACRSRESALDWDRAGEDTTGYQTSGGASVNPSNHTVIADMTPPAGDYMIVARAIISNQGAADDLVACNLSAGGSFVDSGTESVPSSTTATVAATGLGTIGPGGTIAIECIGTSGATSTFVSAHISAVSLVDAVTLP